MLIGNSKKRNFSVLIIEVKKMGNVGAGILIGAAVAYAVIKETDKHTRQHRIFHEGKTSHMHISHHMSRKRNSIGLGILR